jgi:signal peptidase I
MGPVEIRSHNLQGTWPKALRSLFIPIFIILSVRWAAFEPYVIPSGSMLPNLLIHDYILVNKFAYGIRFPFTYHYLFHWNTPQRGEVLVFRNVGIEDYFLVKRVVGLPGDEISYNQKSELMINGQVVPTRRPSEIELEEFFYRIPNSAQTDFSKNFDFMIESFNDAQATRSPSHEHFILRTKSSVSRLEQAILKIPKGQYFMMGDNRDNSADSRVWGLLPLDNILGRATSIWFSCDESPFGSQDFCDPRALRFARIMSSIN